jgi:hypothetical protein
MNSPPHFVIDATELSYSRERGNAPSCIAFGRKAEENGSAKFREFQLCRPRSCLLKQCSFAAIVPPGFRFGGTANTGRRTAKRRSVVVK